MDKTTLTVGQCARYMGCSPNTIRRLIDKGEIEGFLLPGTKDRRVFPEHLRMVMQKHGYPSSVLPPIGIEASTVVCLCTGVEPKPYIDLVHATVDAIVKSGIGAEIVPDTFILGATVSKCRPSMIVMAYEFLSSNMGGYRSITDTSDEIRERLSLRHRTVAVSQREVSTMVLAKKWSPNYIVCGQPLPGDFAGWLVTTNPAINWAESAHKPPREIVRMP